MHHMSKSFRILLILPVLVLIIAAFAAPAFADAPACSVCGKAMTLDAKQSKAATCTEDGFDYYVCLTPDCTGADIQLPVKAKGHDWIYDYSKGKEPTCIEKGRGLKKCSRCKITAGEEEVPALGHDWEYYDTILATCTEDGSCMIRCKRNCGFRPVKWTLQAEGHKWDKWRTVTPPTCTEEGLEEATCFVCHEKGTRPADKLPHNFGENYKIILEATQFSKGLRELTCIDCGSTEMEEYYPDGTLLLTGSYSHRIKELQELLELRGYNVGGADGLMGKKTEKAVSEFESSIGMEPDGIIWPGLLSILRGDLPEDAWKN